MTTSLATVLVPFLVFIVGALVYALASNGKVARLGELAAFCGLFWLVAVFAHEAVRL
jgi:hypothetical protein